MNAVLQNTYELYLDDDRYGVPTLHLIPALDKAAALDLAWRLLSESIHHRGAELWQGNQRLAGLGSFATRRLPAETRIVAAQG